MTRKQLESVLKEHKIHPKFWREFRDLVFHSTRPGVELRTRLNGVSNYQEALDAVLTILSQPTAHIFPPADYQALEECA